MSLDDILVRAGVAIDADDRVAMLACADLLLARDPAQAEGLFIAGMAMLRENRRGLATVLLNAASQVKPDQAGIWNNLACAMQDWHPEDSLHILSKALECDPGLHEAAANVVSVLSQLGRWEEALEQAERVRAAAPVTDPAWNDATYNSALVLMQLGRWAEAWPRWRTGLGNRFRKKLHADLPRWCGSPDAKVVIYGEQGLGDEILGASFYAKAQATGAQLIVDCDLKLEGMFRRSFTDIKVYGTRFGDSTGWRAIEKPTHQLECIGLGELFAPEPVRARPFLKADPALRRAMRGWLDAQGLGLKVGLAWTGGAVDWDRRERNIPTSLLAPITMSPHCQFVCLEYNDPGETMPIRVKDLRWATNKGIDYDLTAALVAELDLVISVPTTVVDLAGALGTPCWSLVPPVPQWRFSEAAGDQAWVYEGIRIYRRKGPHWAPVVQQVARDLRAYVKQQPQRMEAAE